MNRLQRNYRSAFVILMVLIAIAVIVPAYASEGLLDGKKFLGETGELGKTKGDKEEFVFLNGTYDPLACHKYGFSGTSYTAKAEGDIVMFTADHSNKKGDRMKWEGTVKGNTVEGEMTYWQGKKAPRNYWFRGTMVNE